ncbi:MAG: hypothetical protein ACPGXK_04565 [Phycisphaerae bacterium]
MNQFLRRHNKKVMAVLMAFLMVVFIGGTALESLLAPQANATVASSKYGEITEADQRLAENTTALLDRLGFNWRAPASPFTGPTTKPLEIVDWILLQREADSLGMTEPAAAGKANMLQATSEDQIEQLSRRLRVRKDVMYDAVAQFLSIRNLAFSTISSFPPSAAQLRSAARDQLEKVRVNAVMFPANDFLDDMTVVSDDEIKAHFDKYRTKEKGRGVNFGYFIPDAVKVQYIQINRDKIAENLRIPNLEREAKKYYEKNKNIEFRRSPVQLDDGPRTEFLSWEEGREKAEGNIRKERADRMVNRIAEAIISRTYIEESGEDGYRIPSERMMDAGYLNELIQSLPSNLSFPDAVTVAQTDFFTPEQSTTIPEIGGTIAYDGQSSYVGNARDLPFRNKGIIEEVPDQDGIRRDSFLAMNQVSEYALFDFMSGNKFIWRVTDVKKAHAPESFEPMRDQIVEDIKLQRALDEATNYARVLTYAAEEGDLSAAFDESEEVQNLIAEGTATGIRFVEPEPIARARSAATGRDSQVLAGPIGRISAEQLEQCFALQDSGAPYDVLTINDSAIAVAVEWVETIRGNDKEYDELRKTLGTTLVYAQRVKALADWFNHDNIVARAQYEAQY